MKQIFPVQIIHLFIYGLFNNAVSSLHYTGSNDMMINE
jgi:hypothetical protein